MNQKFLNNTIAEELNKWQSILEYGRILLDKDKELRKKHEFILLLADYKPLTILVSVIFDIVVTYVNKENNWKVCLFICSSAILITFILLWIYYRSIAKNFVPKEDVTELNSLLPQVNGYLSSLGFWLTELSPANNVTKNALLNIESEFIAKKSSFYSVESNISKIFGSIDQDIQKLALQYCDKRLAQFKDKIYE